jgi:hypothetical protein
MEPKQILPQGYRFKDNQGRIMKAGEILIKPEQTPAIKMEKLADEITEKWINITTTKWPREEETDLHWQISTCWELPMTKDAIRESVFNSFYNQYGEEGMDKKIDEFTELALEVLKTCQNSS